MRYNYWNLFISIFMSTIKEQRIETVWYLSNVSTATISISEGAIIWLEVNCVPKIDVHVHNTNTW